MVYRYLMVTLLLLTNIFAAQNLKLIEDFEADFIQTVENSSSKTIEYKGKIFIKKSGKALWKYNTPIIKNVYVTGNLVIVDEPELEQAIYTTLEHSINISKLIDDAIQIGEGKYKASLYERDYIISISKNNIIKTLSFSDELGNNVVIKFTNVVENSKITDKIFQFIPPEEYDIIKK